MSISLSSWLVTWVKIGSYSFGAGPAVLTLMRRSIVEDQRLVSEEEFNQSYSLSQLTPGAYLIGMAVLLGRRSGGIRYSILAVLGLLVPGALLTVLLTAFVAVSGTDSSAHHALRGVFAATIGIGFAVFWSLSQPLVKRTSEWSASRTAVFSLLFLAILVLNLFTSLSVPALLFFAGCFWIAWRALEARRSGA